MEEIELIARQAHLIEELRDQVTDLESRCAKALRFIYCIGGPLNDNAEQYDKVQRVRFLRIANALRGGEE